MDDRQALRRYRNDPRFREWCDFLRDAVRSGCWTGEELVAAARLAASYTHPQPSPSAHQATTPGPPAPS